jgi:hypothetical protein
VRVDLLEVDHEQRRRIRHACMVEFTVDGKEGSSRRADDHDLAAVRPIARV